MKPENNWCFSSFLLLLLLSFTCFCSRLCFGRDTITSTNYIKDPASILSNGSNFELGFFNPVNSTNRYVGIWFKQDSPQPVAWVANRDKPLTDTSGVFTISKDGNLVVLDGHNQVLWSSNVSNPAINTSARLLNSGNLVLEDSAGVVIWESFKHPSDKALATMKFITNTRTGEMVELTSWNSPSDPSLGTFSFGLDVHNIPEFIIWNGRKTYWRSGPWNGHSFVGVPDMNPVYLSRFDLVIQDQIYTFSMVNNSETEKIYFFMNSQGNVQETYWDFADEDWKVRWSALKDPCDFYGACGAFGMCDPKTTPVCSCLNGFQPKEDEEWNRGNWTGGCVRKTPLLCGKLNNISTEQGKGDGFFPMKMVKLPHFAELITSSPSGAENCRMECLENCMCTAYAYEDAIGCLSWSGNLIDIKQFNKRGAVLNLRLAYTESEVKIKKIIIAVVISGTLIFIIVIYLLCRWKIVKHERERNQAMLLSTKKGTFLELTREDNIGVDLNKVKLQELPLFDFEKLANATNSFHLSNKLGQGGFGPVYKGTLLDGQEIAVKRLSRASNQGLDEFTNEVNVISKLQHRNLVRLLGCCVDGEEKMLIYEYMPNLSLDALIFDSSKPQILDWRKRFNIIDGIARGLLYLHRDSRLKIIHRDLKASNILLDQDLNPKISDFGMARIFGGNEIQANTLRVVGTYGYISPEYAMQGRFSEKSNVFSFGVLLLEIISGRKNSSFYHHEHVLSLVGLAWKLWIEDSPLSLIDQAIYESCNHTEVLRCIHVGLLCVQEIINDRPNVSTILSMLSSEIADLPPPKQPGFTSMQFESHTNLSQGKSSANMVTITKIQQGR